MPENYIFSKIHEPIENHVLPRAYQFHPDYYLKVQDGVNKEVDYILCLGNHP